MAETASIRSLLGKCLVAFSLPIIAVLAVALALELANAPVRRIQLAPHSAMPQFVRDALPGTQDAYRLAVANPDLLRDIPCYCGCVYMGHRNNLDCYVKAVKAERVTFDEHASGCGICVEITTDVMRLWSEGQDMDAIYAFIVDTYSQRGPSTEDAV
ncbi:MAG: PCYCGC domain-containing protein [Anaerolineae bacterium]|nr:PCYCGC domain-containing protein [Anaerolineae bacterium]